MIRRVPPKQRNAQVSRECDQDAFLRLGLLLLCGLTLAGGFVYAGVQHFTALRIGYQTENLRRVRDQLAEDQRRYLLEREAAANPARLERAARQLGMQPLQPAQIDPLRQQKREKTDKAAPASSQSAHSAGAPPETQGKPIRQKNLDEARLH
jgi:cell division protein FtsL